MIGLMLTPLVFLPVLGQLPPSVILVLLAAGTIAGTLVGALQNRLRKLPTHRQFMVVGSLTGLILGVAGLVIDDVRNSSGVPPIWIVPMAILAGAALGLLLFFWF